MRYQDPPALLVYVNIECEGCGDYTMVLAGHHLRPLIQALQQLVDTVPPELTRAGEIAQILPVQHVTPEWN